MGLLGGLIVGGISRTIGGINNRLQDARRQAPTVRTDTLMGARIGGTGVTVTQQRRIGPGQVPMVPQQYPTQRGRSLGRRSPYRVDALGNVVLKEGYMVNRKGKIQKIPTMQVANPRAAVRALRRIRGFEKIARQIIKVTPKFKSKPTYRGGSRRKSCK